MPDDHLYQSVMSDLGIDPQKVSSDAKRITQSAWDDELIEAVLKPQLKKKVKRK